ncbi:hypothetical protein ANTQUA_LOCUS5632 [Anthophora quadrimaculata]
MLGGGSCFMGVTVISGVFTVSGGGGGGDVESGGGGGFGGSSLVGGLCTFRGVTDCDKNDVSLFRTGLLQVVLGAGTSFNKGGKTENGVGGTGLANCASNDGTSGRLGPCEEPEHKVVVAQAVFCSNCFNNTFCDSSILWEPVEVLFISKSDLATGGLSNVNCGLQFVSSGSCFDGVLCASLSRSALLLSTDK